MPDTRPEHQDPVSHVAQKKREKKTKEKKRKGKEGGREGGKEGRKKYNKVIKIKNKKYSIKKIKSN